MYLMLFVVLCCLILSCTKLCFKLYGFENIICHFVTWGHMWACMICLDVIFCHPVLGLQYFPWNIHSFVGELMLPLGVLGLLSTKLSLKYRQVYNIRCTVVGNKIVDHSDVVFFFEHCLSALLQLHLHSRLNTWLHWIGQRQLQDGTRNI